MRTKEQKVLEEKRLLLQVLKEENGGDKELTIIDYEFIQGCLSIMKTHSLIPQNKRGRRMMVSDHIENLAELAINKQKSLGYVLNPVEINPNDIDSIMYEFTFKYKKAKFTKGGNKRIHTDTATIPSRDEESAMQLLLRYLRKKKEAFVEKIEVKKKHLHYMMKNGDIIKSEDVIGVKR